MAYRFCQILGLVSLGFYISACSVDGEVKDNTVRRREYIVGENRGLISGSQQNLTISGYKISVSLGNYHEGIYQEADGFKVYSSVQGGVAAETFVDVVE